MPPPCSSAVTTDRTGANATAPSPMPSGPGVATSAGSVRPMRSPPARSARATATRTPCSRHFPGCGDVWAGRRRSTNPAATLAGSIPRLPVWTAIHSATDRIRGASCLRPVRPPHVSAGRPSAPQVSTPTTTDGTSRLSHALKWGTIHPRTLLADLDASGSGPDGDTVFSSELAWRDFYADVLFRQPRTAWENLNRKMDAMPVDTDAAARRRLDRWAAGETGFGIVDAGMRQLAATGWMHNRVRMVVASFLVKDLHLPWQWGARHFMAHLVDGDLASNNHGWQWAAGTGTDAAPYFRVFNPTTQQQRYDPDGDYVARWVPDPVEPMLDHKSERDEALRRLESIRS